LPQNDPIVSGILAIAQYLYGPDATPKQQRRCRNMIRIGVLPAKLVAGRLEARASWLDGVYAEPDPPRQLPEPEPEANGHLVDIGPCAREGCTGRVLHERRSGRPPRYCAEHRYRLTRPRDRAA
jgi:hypothetical protein